MNVLNSCANLWDAATTRWSKSEQWNMVQEECGELIAAINQHRRGRLSQEDLASEVADVLIMAAQARHMVGPEIVDRMIAEKLTRLEALVSDD